MSSFRLALTRLLGPIALGATIALAVAPVLAPAPALAAERELARIELTDGEIVEAERFFPTYTTLVILTPGATMRLIPNDRVKAINGVPYEQAYWGREGTIYGEQEMPAATDAAGVTEPEPAAAARPLLPLDQGAVRRYDLTGSRTTWVRHGREMKRNATVELTGLARETVVAAAPEGPVAVRETVIKSQPGEPAEEVQILQLLEHRDDGTYLVGYGLEDPRLGGAARQERIGVPPRMWPNTLEIGQTWTIGPFQRLGLYQTGRMQVVARESVTVPAGTFPDAYKVEGFGHVFGGVANLPTGRLITDHGTITSTTWFVPGIGPVKEERKIHLHQDFFPKGQTGFETPFVVEERTTRALAEHDAGRAR